MSKERGKLFFPLWMRVIAIVRVHPDLTLSELMKATTPAGARAYTSYNHLLHVLNEFQRLDIVERRKDGRVVRVKISKSGFKKYLSVVLSCRVS
jgi:hypothetical protein